LTYGRADDGFITYRTFRFGSKGQIYRGHPPESPEPIAACIGAAQTFGRYVEYPYPELLEARLAQPVDNFGTGGAGPDFFANESDVIAACNRAKVVVVQVMSGRSVSNRFFTVNPLRNARIHAISAELYELAGDPSLGKFVFAHDLLRFLAIRHPRAFAEVIGDARQRWIASYSVLMERLTPPKILFWFSTRPPEGDSMKFPQLIDEATLESVLSTADLFVSCVSQAGMPQSLLRNGRAVLTGGRGQPRTSNTYYPSPEMHQLAADSLAAPITRLAERSSTRRATSS